MRKVWTEAEATQRGRIFLAASVGEMPVMEACEKLQITRQRFYELEDRAVEAFLKALEPKPPGRPSKGPDTTAPLIRKIEAFEKENQKLWLYVKVLRKLAGIEDAEKKRRRPATAVGHGGQEDDR